MCNLSYCLHQIAGIQFGWGAEVSEGNLGHIKNLLTLRFNSKMAFSEPKFNDLSFLLQIGNSRVMSGFTITPLHFLRRWR